MQTGVGFREAGAPAAWCRTLWAFPYAWLSELWSGSRSGQALKATVTGVRLGKRIMHFDSSHTDASLALKAADPGSALRVS